MGIVVVTCFDTNGFLDLKQKSPLRFISIFGLNISLEFLMRQDLSFIDRSSAPWNTKCVIPGRACPNGSNVCGLEGHVHALQEWALREGNCVGPLHLPSSAKPGHSLRRPVGAASLWAAGHEMRHTKGPRFFLHGPHCGQRSPPASVSTHSLPDTKAEF